ncbi:hypothetical protein AMTRI_Chr08g204660 [Amborella trichopoda]
MVKINSDRLVPKVNGLIIYFPYKVHPLVEAKGSIPLIRTDENFTPQEIVQKAAQYFLHILIEVFRTRNGYFFGMG